MNGATIWSRDTVNSEIFFYKPDKWFKIWFYIVSRANYKDIKLFKKGEMLITYQEIINATKATTTQVHKCIKWMLRDKMIDRRRTTRGYIISLKNYHKYQKLDNYKTTTETTDGQVRDKSEVRSIVEESKESKERNIIPKGITKRSFGNEDVNILISKIKETFQLPMLDGSEKENRNYAFLSMKKFGGREKVEFLIEVASKDSFWSNKISSFKQLYYNGVQIISKTRGGKNDNKVATI